MTANDSNVIQSRKLLRKIVEGARLRIGSRCLLFGDLAAAEAAANLIDPLGIDCTVAEGTPNLEPQAVGYQLLLAINHPNPGISPLVGLADHLLPTGRLMILRTTSTTVPDRLPGELRNAGFDVTSQGVSKRRETWNLLTATRSEILRISEAETRAA